jgi:hypothetical protein
MMVKAQSTTSTSTATPNAVVAAAVPPASPAKSKQQITLDTLLAALQEKRKINPKKVEVKQEGSKLVMTIGPGWPIVEIGKGGGISLPQIKSYASAFECVLVGDAKLAAQSAREQKAAAGKAVPPIAPEAKKPNAPVATTKAEPAKTEAK